MFPTDGATELYRDQNGSVADGLRGLDAINGGGSVHANTLMPK